MQRQAHTAVDASPAATTVGSGARDVLNLYLSDTRRLFNSMDPAPFRERELDPAAAAYIVQWAEELPASQPLSMVVRLGSGPKDATEASIVGDSVHEYFQRRAVATRRQLQQMFRLGRYSLLIALAFMAVVTVIGESLASFVSSERYAALIEHSLVIGAWVALWRPLEIFLYDWWPVRAEARLFDRLGVMDVRVVGSDASTAVNGDAA
ncbi:MAG TPA: hypothetical protein VLT59_12495 [Steroidobacteraceae bacterium]|nr:hypothetical protein [Steroidobacteraceae bacterium]